MTELLKAQTNCGIKPSLCFLRDKEGHEIDALIETVPNSFQAVEVKSGETIASDFFAGLDYWRTKLTRGKTPPLPRSRPRTHRKPAAAACSPQTCPAQTQVLSSAPFSPIQKSTTCPS